MRFLVDAQLPPALAKWIAEKGHPASAVRDQGLRNSDDGSIANFAAAGDWVVVTKDEDIVERALNHKDGTRVCGFGSATARATLFSHGLSRFGRKLCGNSKKDSASSKSAATELFCDVLRDADFSLPSGSNN